MAEVKAELNNLRQSPRKVRLVTDLVKGKSAASALNQLEFADKKATQPIIKLIKSAIANARVKELSEESLYIKEIKVDGGAVMKRSRPAAFGRAHPIKKRTSHISIILTTDDIKQTTKRAKKQKTGANK
jgi:large subunit ribosomal protein L22